MTTDELIKSCIEEQQQVGQAIDHLIVSHTVLLQALGGIDRNSILSGITTTIININNFFYPDNMLLPDTPIQELRELLNY